MIQLIWYTQVNNQQKKAWTNSLKYILDQGKQAIEAKKSDHPTGTLVTTFQKPVGGANPYVRFGCVPQKISNHIRGKFSGSMNAEQINAKKRSTINDANMITKNPKDNTWLINDQRHNNKLY